MSGLLLTGPGEIWVNREEAIQWPGRRRFTICHELGHWELHRTGQQSLFCRTASVDEKEASRDLAATTKPALPVTEEEANAFAAALLMPAHLIRREYKNLNGNNPALCDRFKCSAKAMSYRIDSVVPTGRLL